MSKGSPGGILLIAFGVLFVRLAYTGRVGAVWNALMTGESSGSSSLPGDTGKTAGVPPCEVCPVFDCTNALKATDCKSPYVWCQCNNVAGCCKPTKPTANPDSSKNYYNYNAAGAPYQTNAGNSSL